LFGEGAVRFDEIDMMLSHDLARELTIAAADPSSARYHLDQSCELGREGWRILIETRTSMHASATDFILRGNLRAFENGALAASRDWEVTIPRDHM
jgi:hypothetical protein